MLESSCESGRSLTGILSTVLILGVLVVAALKTVTSSSSGLSPNTEGDPTTLSSGSHDTRSDQAQAGDAACRATYQIVTVSLQDYEAVNGGRPPRTISALLSALKDPVSNPYYTFGIDPHGDITVAVSGHPATPGDTNCAYAG
jgi:hypothetical protein